MEKMTKKDRFKKYMYDNAEGIASITVALAAAGATVAALSKIAKDLNESNNRSREAVNNYNDWAGRQNEWIDKQHDDGKLVYLLHDATYLTVPNDAPVEWHNPVT